MRSAPLPDNATLQDRLADALGCSVVRVIERRPNRYSSTFPSEVAKLELAHRGELHAFIKYESGRSNGSHGHRGGVSYEASVYRALLGPLGVSVADLYGFCADGQEAQAFLVTEYMAGSTSVNKVKSTAAMARAADWIGQFHACGERLLACRTVPDLRRYNRAYYLGWSGRAEEALAEASVAAEWLPAAFAGFRQSVGSLLSTAASPIHGEYYPRHILVHAGRVGPTDWESVAVAAGRSTWLRSPRSDRPRPWRGAAEPTRRAGPMERRPSWAAGCASLSSICTFAGSHRAHGGGRRTPNHPGGWAPCSP